MKIGPYSDPKIATVSGARPASAASPIASTAAGQQRAQAGVAVSMSDRARSLGAAAASGDNDIDHVKVKAMQDAIANGTFSVNAGAIADKLLANAQEMLDRVRR